MVSFSLFLETLASNPFLAVVIVLVLGTIFVNGATDAANAIAESVGTRSIGINAAIAMSVSATSWVLYSCRSSPQPLPTPSLAWLTLVEIRMQHLLHSLRQQWVSWPGALVLGCLVFLPVKATRLSLALPVLPCCAGWL